MLIGVAVPDAPSARMRAAGCCQVPQNTATRVRRVAGQLAAGLAAGVLAEADAPRRLAGRAAEVVRWLRLGASCQQRKHSQRCER